MQINVVEYNPKWPSHFEQESLKLQNLLGDLANNIHHIGSTAVSGLMAKPIIDILLDVSQLEGLDNKTNEFEKLGYEVMGEFGIAGRRYFRKGGDNRTHQIHAFLLGDPNLIRHLAFRDYLIAHKTIAKEYGELKYKIAQSNADDIEKYCDQKDPFIKHHESIALEWYRNVSK